MMALSEQQKKRLRGLGQRLKPIVLVGQAGVTPAVVHELDQALERHELVKIKVRVGARPLRADLIAALVAATGAELVQTIGHVALLYRPAPEATQPVLPAG